MSLISNARDVAFSTRWPTDKIINVWEGSFNRATEVTTVTGDLGTIYVYRIAHGLTRPVACDLLWTIGGAWTDGGSYDASTDISIAYSDSTYIYVISSLYVAAAGTMQYKVLGYWIDEYDTSNPLVESFVSSNKNTVFDTRDSYQKIYDQNVLGFGSSSTQPILHSLGYRPNYRVFYEAISGQVWPMFAGGISNPFLYDTSMAECTAYTTTTTLSVELSSVTSTRRAWYKIYLDD